MSELGLPLVSYQWLEQREPTQGLLIRFNRHQEVSRCWRSHEDGWRLEQVEFVEEWTDEQLGEVERELAAEVAAGGAAVLAVAEGRVVGFASVSARALGPAGQYRQVPLLHVSCEWRGRGVGKRLFALVAERARRLGGEKLYLSTQSSEQTQAFYCAMGCRAAEYPDAELVALEPFDVQLEREL